MAGFLFNSSLFNEAQFNEAGMVDASNEVFQLRVCLTLSVPPGCVITLTEGPYACLTHVVKPEVKLTQA